MQESFFISSSFKHPTLLSVQFCAWWFEVLEIILHASSLLKLPAACVDLFWYQSEICLSLCACGLVHPPVSLDACTAVDLILLLFHVLSDICIQQAHVTLLPVVSICS